MNEQHDWNWKQVARATSVKCLLRASAALAILAAVTACKAAVTKDSEPPGEPEVAFSFVGTWRYEQPRWEMLEEDEGHVIVGTDIRTLTFTKSRWIEHVITVPNDLAPPDMQLWDFADSGTWGSVTGSTITKTFLGWNDEEESPNDEPTHVVRKYHIVSGNLVLMQLWYHDEPDEDPYVRIERVNNPEADLVGRWVDDDGENKVVVSLGADGSFHRVFTRTVPLVDELNEHETTGTYELDTDEKFILVTLTQTLWDGEVRDVGPFWEPGEILRFAYAPSNIPTRIAFSNAWREQTYDPDLGMKVDIPENRYGAYWQRFRKVE